ncbi:MAG: CAP domain-containing protein [Solirubrobacteraceae bacterium]
MERVVSHRLLIVLTAILALAVTASSAHAAGCRGADASPGQASSRTLDQATLCLMNAERHAHGRAPLRAQHALGRAAAAYARAMVRGRFFDHVSPGGSTMVARVRATAYLHRAGSYSIGENIAWGGGYLGTPRAIVRAWMHSAGHRANLLSPAFRDVGVGVAAGVPDGSMPGGTYVCDFGRRG